MQEFAAQTSGASSSTGGKEGLAGLQTMSGVQELPTGDILIRTAGIVTLVTPSGDRVVIDAEGKLSIEGKVVGADRNKEGVSSICFKDNAIIKVDKHGLLEIHRDGQVLKFPRKEEVETADSEPAAQAQAEPASKAASRQAEPVKEAPVQARTQQSESAARVAEPSSKQEAAPESNKKWRVPAYELPGLDISL